MKYVEECRYEAFKKSSQGYGAYCGVHMLRRALCKFSCIYVGYIIDGVFRMACYSACYHKQQQRSSQKYLLFAGTAVGVCVEHSFRDTFSFYNGAFRAYADMGNNHIFDHETGYGCHRYGGVCSQADRVKRKDRDHHQVCFVLYVVDTRRKYIRHNKAYLHCL